MNERNQDGWLNPLKSLFGGRDERHAQHMKKLLSTIPCYALNARQRYEEGGEIEEMRYWLELYRECHNQQFRAVLLPRREH